jgi:hypothetical protein
MQPLLPSPFAGEGWVWGPPCVCAAIFYSAIYACLEESKKSLAATRPHTLPRLRRGPLPLPQGERG